MTKAVVKRYKGKVTWFDLHTVVGLNNFTVLILIILYICGIFSKQLGVLICGEEEISQNVWRQISGTFCTWNMASTSWELHNFFLWNVTWTLTSLKYGLFPCDIFIRIQEYFSKRLTSKFRYKMYLNFDVKRFEKYSLYFPIKHKSHLNRYEISNIQNHKETLDVIFKRYFKFQSPLTILLNS